MSLIDVLTWTVIIVMVRLALVEFVVEPLMDEESRKQATDVLAMMMIVIAAVAAFSPDPNVWLLGGSLVGIMCLSVWLFVMIPIIIRVVPTIRR